MARSRSKYWVGSDKTIVERKETKVHWSELPTPTNTFPPTKWYEQDNNPASPLEQDLDEIN